MTDSDVFQKKAFICGLAAGITKVVVAFPLVKVSVAQVIERTDALSESREVYNTFKSLKFRALYRGVLPPLCHKSITSCFMFGFYENVFNYLNKKNVKHATYWSACCSGLAETTLIPFDRVVIVLMNKEFNERYKNMFDATVKLGKEYGIKEYYRGGYSILARNLLGNLLFFKLKRMSDFYIKENIQGENVQSMIYFLHGGIMGVIISTICYPLGVIRIEQQKVVGTVYTSMTKILRDFYINKQLSELFRGATVNGVRAFVSWGVVNGSYELYSRFYDLFITT